MSKSDRLEALKETLDKVLPNTLMNYDARVMLFTFIKGFKILRYRKDSKGWAKAWYTFIAVPMFIDGYIRDVRVNSTTGKLLFGDFSIKDKYFGLSTLTGTLQRVIDSGSKAENYDLACQIGIVLNDYDPGHIKFKVA